MKTVDIVKGLLEYTKKQEWSAHPQKKGGAYCTRCEHNILSGHAEDCSFDNLIKAAEFYIKYTEGATK